jgi:hypothetical protein
MAGLPMTIATTILSIGLRRRLKADLAAFVVLAAFMIPLSQYPLPRADDLVALAPVVVLVEALVTFVFARDVLAVLSYPPSIAEPTSWLRLRSAPWMLGWPEVYRGFTVASSGLALAVVGAPLVVLFRVFANTEGRHGDMAVMYLWPVVIGLGVLSQICREDALAGRIDVMRQSPRPPWIALPAIVAGLWLPFVVASVLLALLVWALLWVKLDGLLFAIIAVAVTAPLPLIEGWGRTFIFSFTGTSVFAFAVWAAIGAWPAVAAVLILNWWLALQSLASAARLAPRWSVAATGLLSGLPFAAVEGERELALSAFALVMLWFSIAPLLEPPDRHRPVERWAIPVTVATVVAIAASFHVSFVVAFLIGGSAALSSISGLHISRSLPMQPQVQSGVRLFVLLGLFGVDAAVRGFHLVRIDALGVAAQGPLLLILSESAILFTRWVVTRFVRPS